MLKIGVIGTSWITDDFIKACLSTNKYEFIAVYSRTLETGTEFANKYEITNVFTSVDEMCEIVDVVYIASPNGMHYQHTEICLNRGVHVVCEKTSFTSLSQLERIKNICDKKEVFFFEAVRTIYTKKYDMLQKQFSKIGKIRYAYFSYMKYSSKYNDYKNGNILPSFKPGLSGGSNYDLGIYLIHMNLLLFGNPGHISYHPIKLWNGIDGLGTLIFNYGTHLVVNSTSKISGSVLNNEIQGENGTIVFNDISDITRIEVITDKTEVIELEALNDLMYDEALIFGNAIIKGDTNFFEKTFKQTKKALEILEQARIENNIVFEEIN